MNPMILIEHSAGFESGREFRSSDYEHLHYCIPSLMNTSTENFGQSFSGSSIISGCV